MLIRCANMRCTPYEYLRMLAETDLAEKEEKQEDEQPIGQGIKVTRE